MLAAHKMYLFLELALPLFRISHTNLLADVCKDMCARSWVRVDVHGRLVYNNKKSWGHPKGLSKEKSLNYSISINGNMKQS